MYSGRVDSLNQRTSEFIQQQHQSCHWRDVASNLLKSYCIIPIYLQTRQADICGEGWCPGRIPIAKPGAVAGGTMGHQNWLRKTWKTRSNFFWMSKSCPWKVKWSNHNWEDDQWNGGHIQKCTLWAYSNSWACQINPCQSGSGQPPTTRMLSPKRVWALHAKAWALQKSVVLVSKWGPQWPMITWMEWCAILFSHYTPDWFIQQTDVSQSKYCTPDRHSGTETPRMNVDSTHFHGHSFTCLAERLPFLNICGTVKNIDHQIAELGCTQFRVRSVSC